MVRGTRWRCRFGGGRPEVERRRWRLGALVDSHGGDTEARWRPATHAKSGGRVRPRTYVVWRRPAARLGEKGGRPRALLWRPAMVTRGAPPCTARTERERARRRAENERGVELGQRPGASPSTPVHGTRGSEENAWRPRTGARVGH